MGVFGFSRGGFRVLAGMVIVILMIAGHAWSQETDATSSASRTSGAATPSVSKPSADAATSASKADATSSASRFTAAATSSASRTPGARANLSTTVYDIAQGPALRISLLLALLGLLYRFRQFRRFTRMAPGRGKYRPEAVLGLQHENRPVLASLFPGPARPKSGTHPVMRTVSLVFHILLFLVPLLLPAHNILLARRFHASLPAIPGPLADWLTIVLIAAGGFFLLRRVFFPRVRVLSTVYDYGVLLLVLAPFVTGLMAYHHVTTSHWLMVVHVISADALFAAIPFTKLGHMPFLLFARFFVSGEYALRPAARAWGRAK